MKDLEPLSPELKELLDAERGAPEPAPERRERVRSRLWSALGLAAGAGAASALHGTPALGSTALKAAPAAGKLLVAKIAVGVIAAAAVGTTMHYALRTPPPPAHMPPAAARHVVPPSAVKPVVAAPIAAPAAPSPAPPVAAPVPAPAQPAPFLTTRVHRPAHLEPPGDDLAAERVLLDHARSALSSGDTAGALDALAQHEQRFPKGQLTEEREALRIRALARAGNAAAARTRADQFRARFPHSIFRPAVDATIQSLP
jgi:hypothetical protein